LLRFFHKPHMLFFPSHVLELGSCMLGMGLATHVYITFEIIFFRDTCAVIKIR
jgi:hypothetical protein